MLASTLCSARVIVNGTSKQTTPLNRRFALALRPTILRSVLLARRVGDLVEHLANRLHVWWRLHARLHSRRQANRKNSRAPVVLRKTLPHRMLLRLVVEQREGLQLIQVDPILAVQVEQGRCERAQLQASLHRQHRHAPCVGDLLRSATLFFHRHDGI